MPEVDLDAALIRVGWQLKHEEGRWVWKPPKTRRSRRQIALLASTVAILRAHRAAQEEQRLRIGSAWEDHELVLCTRHGRPLAARNIYRAFSSLAVETITEPVVQKYLTLPRMNGGDSRDRQGRRSGQRYPRLPDQLDATDLPLPKPLGTSSRMVRIRSSREASTRRLLVRRGSHICSMCARGHSFPRSSRGLSGLCPVRTVGSLGNLLGGFKHFRRRQAKSEEAADNGH